MKTVSRIRSGLAKIEGALEAFPPKPGYEGPEDAVSRGRTIRPWENPNFRPQNNGYIVNPDGYSDDEADDDDFREVNPFFEIGADVDECFPGLDGEEGKKIEQSVLLHGMDALGGYLSFHYTGLQWGIYIPISGIVYMIRNVFGGLSAPLVTKAHLAFHAILNHELFHFATDYAIAQAELAHQEPWYIPAKKEFRAVKPYYCAEEEQMANAYMLAAFSSMKPALRMKGKQAALQAFIAKQPEGYCEALCVLPQDWDLLLSNLAHCYGSHANKSAKHPSLWDPSLGYDWAQQFPLRPRINWRYCPIHLVDDSTRLGIPSGWLSFFSRLSAIEETADFKKKLEKLASPIQWAWERTKKKLGTDIPAGADFKKWGKGENDLFSVRVNHSVRAHLRRRRESDDWHWQAVAIGNHKEMGHG